MNDHDAPQHLNEVGVAAWDEAVALLQAAQMFDPRDTPTIATYAELTQAERAAWNLCLANPANDKANLNYARLQKQRLAVLDALGLSAKSRAKLGIENRDEAADEIDAFIDEGQK